MDLTSHIESLRNELLIAAEAGGEETRKLAERLVSALGSATRLTLLEALSEAAQEITRELAPGSVELRLRGRDPDFIVTSPRLDEVNPSPTEASNTSQSALPASQPDMEEGGTSRITLRLPEHLKPRIEQAASQDGLSVNAWLVRAASRALDTPTQSQRAPQNSSQSSQHVTGWVR